MLEAILQKLNTNSETVNPRPPEIHISPPGTLKIDSITSTGHVKVKPATPLDFDGDYKKGWGFLNTYTIYLAICGDSFPNEQAHIYWSLSFLKTGRAAHFTDWVLWGHGTKGSHAIGIGMISSQTLLSTSPKNEQLSTLTKLEGSSWYQGKDSVEDYTD